MKKVAMSQGLSTIVDDADYEVVSAYKWRVQKSKSGPYARAWTPMKDKKRTLILIHRLIASRTFPSIDGFLVDHRNGDGLDNRRENLRLCKHSQNAMNKRCHGSTSWFKGVSCRANSKKWRAAIRANGDRIDLGSFDTEIEAAQAYDRAAKDLFGEFARLNNPDAA